MGHGHGHHHHGGLNSERRLLFVMLLTGSFMLVEAAGGVIAGSLALLADAAHMFTDTMALMLAWVGFVMGRRAADHKRTYGYRRFEVLAAWLNGIVLILLCGWIAFEAAQRLLEPQPVLPGPMLTVAVLGLTVNVVVLWILHRDSRENLNMRGAALHVLGDMLGSMAAIIAAVGIMFTGWMPLDPLLSVVVATLILRSAWLLVKQATHILLEGAPEGFDVDRVSRAIIEAVPTVQDVHHVHAWSLTSGRPLVTLHARVIEGVDAHDVLLEIKRVLHNAFDVDHSVVQFETGTCPDHEH